MITSDNPRCEDPERIIEEITARHHAGHAERRRRRAEARCRDRRIAARRSTQAIELARPGDLVLVAGKGHEKYQVIGDRALPFDDVAVAREALARRRTDSRCRRRAVAARFG